MSSFIAVYDACVLHPAYLRDLLLHLARTNLFRARWTDQIHDEWINSVRSKRPDITPAKLARTRTLMDAAVPDCLVVGYQGLVDDLSLPDPADRHVLAAALRCQAGVIVTYNTGDFPQSELAQFGVEAQHPDEFVMHTMDLSKAAVCAAVRDQRKAMTKPHHSTQELLASFLGLGLASTVAALEPMQELL